MSEQERTGQHAATGRHLAPPKPKRPSTGETGKQRATAAQSAVPPTEPAAPPKPKKPKKTRRSLYAAILLAAFVFLVGAAILMRTAQERRRYDEYYTQALSSYRAGQYDEALAGLRRAAKLEESEDVLRLMADCYDAQGNYERALELMRRLDLKDEDVQKRIGELEVKRVQSLRADMVTVNGQDYDAAAQSLVIRDQSVSDDLLEEVTQLYALSNLTLSGLGLREIGPLASLGGLTSLDLSRNQISDLRPLTALTELRSLYLDGNPIQDLSPLYSLTGLTTLSIRGIEITDKALAALSEALPNCAIHSENAVESVAEITIGGSTFPADVTALDLSGRALTDISVLSACKSLKRLDLTGNQISDLSPLMELPGLEELIVKDNLISDLRPLISLPALRLINAEGNAIASVKALGMLTSLEELHLGQNPIADFSGLEKLTDLETLGLEDTGLTDAALASLKGLPRLRLLTIYDNPALSGEAVDDFKRAMSYCYVQHSKLVYSVTIAGEEIRRNVKELDLSDREVTEFANLRYLAELESLRMSGCGIGSIETLQFLTRLRTLDLSRNQIRDPSALMKLTRLEKLDLSSNQIQETYYFKGMTWLRQLDLSGNPLSAEAVEDLRAELPDCTILFN